MKALYLILLATLLAGSCTKPYYERRKTIIGTWKQTAYYFSIGGPGEWKAADPRHPSYASFNSDSTADFSYDGKTSTYRFKLIDSMTMKLINGQGETQYRYSLISDDLTLYPPCIEGCAQKYRPVSMIK